MDTALFAAGTGSKARCRFLIGCCYCCKPNESFDNEVVMPFAPVRCKAHHIVKPGDVNAR